MSDYHDRLKKWRKAMDVNLIKENSWLSLAGLYWLEEGENAFGSDPINKIVLPAGSGPGRIGTFWFNDGIVSLQVDEGIEVKIDRKTLSEAQIMPDTSGTPTEISLGNLKFMLIKRDDSLGIRLWDNNRPERMGFPGRQWYPIDENYRLTGTYCILDGFQQLQLDRKNGVGIEVSAAGEVEFSLDEQVYSLFALEEDDGKLFLMFNDSTNGEQTYTAGRYLVTDPPLEGTVVLDFNRAYNPPCAFTDYATCPLPPGENKIDIPIPAGELKPKEIGIIAHQNQK
jgi:uncharacterized protein (DUF1684 family)